MMSSMKPQFLSLKNQILFICAILTMMTFTFCANPEDEIDLNCLDQNDGLHDQCGLIPIPSVNDTPIDFCSHIQTLVDQAEVNGGLTNKQNIIIEDRGVHPVVAAPHGASDLGTDDIANKVGDNLNINSLRFFRFRTLLNANVNRPTAGAPTAAQEAWDYDASAVYHCYRGHVLDLFKGNSNNFYVEIHGNDRAGSAQRLEIVCSDDITNAQDQSIKAIFAQEIINVYGANTPLQAFTLAQDPNNIYFTASATRTCGLFCSLQNENIPAIHVEIPAAYRGDFNSAARVKIVNLLTTVISRIDSEVL